MVNCGGRRSQAGRAGSRSVQPSPRRPPIRLTRRGRRVRGVLVSMVYVGVLVAAPVLVAQPGVASSEPGAGVSEVVVRPGESLWTLAVRHAPGRDPFATVEEIRRLNRLSGYVVHPGQRLRLP